MVKQRLPGSLDSLVKILPQLNNFVEMVNITSNLLQIDK